MPVKQLTYDVIIGGESKEIISLDSDSSYKSVVEKLTFETLSADETWLNDTVSVSLGYDGGNTQIFQGYVDSVNYRRLPGVYDITCSNILKLAEKHYIVTDDLDSPWTRSNISAENLVGDLLAEAGITSYVGKISNFTFGVSSAVEFNMISILDAISQLNNILAYTIYAENGTVYWNDTRPEPGVSSQTINKFTSINYNKGTDNLRNKVIVFGRNDIYAEASAISPYLPSGFYQTAIVSSEMIDQQSMADDSASYNLDLMNRLTEELRIEIEGNTSIKCRDTITVVDSVTGINSDWFVYGIKHTFNDTFLTSLQLRK